MKTHVLYFGTLALVLLLASCTGQRETITPGDTWQVTDDLRVTELRPGVWMHTSWTDYNGSRVSSNGLLVREGDGLMLIDTAWGEAPTDALLDWTEATLGLPVTQAFATHWHADRMGGAAVLEARNIPFYASPLTQQLADAAGLPQPEILDVSEVGDAENFGTVEVFYPGHGHTADNTVVWLPAHRLLFGGCAVKSAAAGDLGYVGDADLESWPESIRRVQIRYGEADLVVPGHGDPGGTELLAHTLDLLEQ